MYKILKKLLFYWGVGTLDNTRGQQKYIMEVLFIDGRPTGRSIFHNFTQKDNKSLPNFSPHTNDVKNIFKEHCPKKTRKHYAQTIEEYDDDSPSFSHSLQNFKNLNDALEWASTSNIRWIFISCGSYGWKQGVGGMSQEEYLRENKRYDDLMEVFREVGIRVFIPGGNTSSEDDYDDSYTWCPNDRSECVTLVPRDSSNQYDYTSKETAKVMAQAVRSSMDL